MINPKVGTTYTLTFANSPEGEAELGSESLVAVMICETAQDNYLVFVSQTNGVEFFFHSHDGCAKNGQWWDEEHWTQLVSVEVLS